MGYITVGDNQNFLDVVLMGCGTLQSAMAVAAANDMSITATLMPGSLIYIPDGIPSDYTVLNSYAKHNIVVGTKEEGTAGALLNEDGAELLNEDGTALLVE